MPIIDDDQRRRMSVTSARLTMAFSNVGHFFTHFLMLIYATVVLALDGKFDLSYGELLSLSLPAFILYGAAALPAGWLGDRWSAEAMMVIFFIGSGIAAIMTGLATSPLGIAVGLGLIGLFGSIYHPVGVAWLVRNAENRGAALGWNGIFGSLGLGFAAVAAGSMAKFLSWRVAFILPGALCALVGVALFYCVRRGLVVAAKVDRKPEPEASRADVIRAFVVLTITMLAASLISQAVTVALPKIFAERLPTLTGGDVAAAGTLVTLVFLGSSAAQIVGGWLADRFPLKRVYVTCWALQVPFWFIAASLINLPLLGTVMLVEVLGIFTLPSENSLLVRYTPARWRATAFGAKFALLGLSALAIPLVGMIYDRTGDFYALFVALTLLAAVIVVAAIFLPADARNRPLRAAVQPAE
jgi:MFS family permease